jgi:hypothetical protein
VFTARYELSPYIKENLVFKGLNFKISFECDKYFH